MSSAERPHIEHILHAAGCHLILLPPCHPELNYIEMIRAYMKREFRGIPPIDRKGAKFRPTVEACVNNVPDGLAGRCFKRTAEIIELLQAP